MHENNVTCPYINCCLTIQVSWVYSHTVRSEVGARVVYFVVFISTLI